MRGLSNAFATFHDPVRDRHGDGRRRVTPYHGGELRIRRTAATGAAAENHENEQEDTPEEEAKEHPWVPWEFEKNRD